jgi:Ulp1 family protease
MYQTALPEEDLNEILDADKEVNNFIIDAYLEMLTTSRNGNREFGFIPTYVVNYFRRDGLFTPDWLLQMRQHGIGHVRYWHIPAHLNGNHWVLTVMDVQENEIIFYDSLAPRDLTMTNLRFMVDIYGMFQALYARLGDQRSEQFNWQIGRMEGRHNVPTQENGIDCGVFMLMFAADIVQQRSLHPVMGIRQNHIGQAREQIYRDLLAFR